MSLIQGSTVKLVVEALQCKKDALERKRKYKIPLVLLHTGLQPPPDSDNSALKKGFRII